VIVVILINAWLHPEIRNGSMRIFLSAFLTTSIAFMEEYRLATAFTVPGRLRTHQPVYIVNLPAYGIQNKCRKGGMQMKSREIREIAVQHYIKTDRAKRADLVRAIQSAEGNQQCFGSNSSGECGQEGCVWRDDCV
jgi:hypothetical protein